MENAPRVGLVEDYDRIYRQLTRIADLHDVSSAFAMQELKSTTVLPLTS